MQLQFTNTVMTGASLVLAFWAIVIAVRNRNKWTAWLMGVIVVAAVIAGLLFDHRERIRIERMQQQQRMTIEHSKRRILRETDSHVKTYEELHECLPIADGEHFETALTQLEQEDSLRHMIIDFTDAFGDTHRERMYYVSHAPAPASAVPPSGN